LLAEVFFGKAGLGFGTFLEVMEDKEPDLRWVKDGVDVCGGSGTKGT